MAKKGQMEYYDIISQLEKKKYFSWYKIYEFHLTNEIMVYLEMVAIIYITVLYTKYCSNSFTYKNLFILIILLIYY